VSLHNPLLGLKFIKSMIEMPDLYFEPAGGSSEGESVCEYSKT